MPDQLPSGTVTFLFTDVEGSTKLLHELGADGYAEALAEHRRIVREACARHDGVEVDTQGDAFFVAFPSAPGALSAADDMTKALASGPILVRVGLHTGMPLLTEEGYVGGDVHLGARIAASAHGGQVVCSRQTFELVELELTDLGEHRLKDIADAVSIYQLGDDSFPPLKTISNTNLPRPASSFVGREQETAEVVSLLRDGTRLLTLSGSGGTGKTRLSIEAASELVPDFKAGVFWVGLATLRDSALVTETVAQTLGAKDGLAEHIAERELLLLLDNLEQVIEAAPELSSLLSACPNLTLLVTSRELLRISGEVEYAVPPLAEPEAVLLFCERAQTEPNERIAELCGRLDNLPLAVELAAARTKALSPAQILERLSQRLDLLKGGRDADPRQQTLRATIEWSYDLLSPEEQQLFARLSVFAGGCTLEAAEEVAEADLDTLQSLVEKSLLRFTDERYWMLETIREYAIERLDDGGRLDAVRARHATYMADVYGAIDTTGNEWLQRVESERDNLRAAMSASLDRPGSERALSLAITYAALCRVRGPFGEGVHWLDAALDRKGEALTHLRWRALLAAATLATVQGSLEYAQARGDEALHLAREDGDTSNVAKSVRALGIVAADAGDLQRSEALQREALELFVSEGDEKQIRESLGLVAFLAILRRDWPSARASIDDALALSRSAGDRHETMRNVSNLAYVLLREGKVEEALLPLRESLALVQEQADLFGLASQIDDVGCAAGELEVSESAAVMLGGAEALYEQVGRQGGPLIADWRDSIIERLRRVLGHEQFEACWSRGRRMTADELVAYAAAFIDSAM